jgi:hypothetical protein
MKQGDWAKNNLLKIWTKYYGFDYDKYGRC